MRIADYRVAHQLAGLNVGADPFAPREGVEPFATRFTLADVSTDAGAVAAGAVTAGVGTDPDDGSLFDLLKPHITQVIVGAVTGLTVWAITRALTHKEK